MSNNIKLVKYRNKDSIIKFSVFREDEANLEEKIKNMGLEFIKEELLSGIVAEFMFNINYLNNNEYYFVRMDRDLKSVLDKEELESFLEEIREMCFDINSILPIEKDVYDYIQELKLGNIT